MEAFIAPSSSAAKGLTALAGRAPKDDRPTKAGDTSVDREGVYVTPTLPVWRTRLTMDQMQPEYAFPERLKQSSVRRSAEEDELVSRPRQWTVQDLERLCLDKPHTLPAAPQMLILPDTMPRQKQQRVRAVEQQSSSVQPEKSDDHEPPLADFTY